MCLTASLPEFAWVSRLIFLGRLDDALELLRSLGPHERPGVLVVLGDVIQQELLELPFRSVHALRQTLFAKEMRAARLDADFRNIESAAYSTTFTDDLGHQYYPPSRDGVVEDLKEDDIMDDKVGRGHERNPGFIEISTSRVRKRL